MHNNALPAVNRRKKTQRILSLACALHLPAMHCLAEEQGSQNIEVSTLGAEERSPYVDHLKTAGKDPRQYVIDKFSNHDLVMLGEAHQVRENCVFVASLIAPLYHKAGVRQLATEFVSSSDQGLVDRLINADTYDKSLALEILRGNAWPTWGYQEYADIFHAVWKLNRSLESKTDKFRVLCLDSDWSQHEFWFGNMKRPEVYQTTMKREKQMTRLLKEEALESEVKTLVHIGFTHTITCHGIYVGTALTKDFGKRVFQICLHQEPPSRKGQSALVRFLETTIAENGKVPIGFDILDSVFGKLKDKKVAYWRMKPKLGFSAFAQGYVFLRPLDELHTVTWMDGFINEANFERARDVAEKMRWIKKGDVKNAAELNKQLAIRFDGSD